MKVFKFICVGLAAGVLVGVFGLVGKGKSNETTFAYTARQRSRGGEEFRWRGVIASGRSIEVKGVKGAITARMASGDEVEVIARKRGRRAEDVIVDVVEHSGNVTICAVYPSRRRSRPNFCAPGDRGRNNVRNNDVQVDFAVYVPAGVRFVGRTVNGAIDAEELESNVSAQTVNGAIDISTSGHAQAKTVNGSIEASIGSWDWSGELTFSAVNGGIKVYLPDNCSADINASTVSGGISTDFPLTVRGRYGRHSLSGSIGGGGPDLKLTTVNGSIALQKR